MAIDFKQEFSDRFFPLLVLLVAEWQIPPKSASLSCFVTACDHFHTQIYDIIAPILNYSVEIESNLDLR